MNLKEIKEWVNQLPEEFLEFTVVNGEEGLLNDEYWYRLDKPILSIVIDKEEKEVVFLNESNKPLTENEIKQNV